MPCAFHLWRPPPFDRLDPSCQFKVPESELMEFDGKAWCPFHLPYVGGEMTPSPKASWDDATANHLSQRVITFVDAAGSTIDLAGVVLPSDVDFRMDSGAPKTFRAICVLGAHFGARVWFDNTQFAGDAWFEDVQFDGDVQFDRVRFGGHAWFNQARFRRRARFREIRCEQDAWFIGAQFSAATSFERAQFSGAAYFEQSQFRNIANFSGAEFKNAALFESARFGKSAIFTGSSSYGRPIGDANNIAGDYFRRLDFSRALFDGRVEFSNRRFFGHTNFSGAKFAVAPDFYNCDLHQDTDFGETVLEDTESYSAARAYRTLKLAMEQHRARDEEARFFALEMKSRRRRKDTRLQVKIFSWLYEKTADYGQSMWRPMACLFGFLVVFFLIYLAAKNPDPIGWTEFAERTRFTVLQVVRPFDAFTDNNVPLGVAFIAAFHSTASLSFVALFLLALRRRFRMG